ncbi:MAG TPA: ATPase, T2SS/T4P/T4SS family [Acidobacteriota bacterium]|nr:ATPase, T2SS/T4P/T4SS family [Acidobacteriota bacterium]
MTTGGRKPLGQSLVEQGHLAPERLARALEEQRRTGATLRDVLLQRDLVPESAILDYYEEQLGVPRMDLSTYALEPEIVRLVPERVSRHYRVVALFRIGNTLTVAMADPLDVLARDEVRLATGLEVDVVVASEAQILDAIDRHAPAGGSLESIVREQGLKQAAAAVAARPEEDGPIIRFVNALIEQAAREGASDLHVEPEEAMFRIRIRVDGQLREVSAQGKGIYPSVVSRIKVMASLDISERRLPQDGRIRTQVAGRDFDLRVSTFPTIHGENVVLRLLDLSSPLRGLAELGIAPADQTLLEGMIGRPHGVVLVTGPTGSGKTTTLYACIHAINTVSRNIVTLEDPVEYHVSAVRQTQVDPDIGLSYARGLRALLRQDPDVILVGEIRDDDTAEIAIRSAMTGHLVLSTLHTNDASGAVPRLLGMGLAPYLLASALNGIVAQRLLRRVCEKCRRSVAPPAALLASLGLEPGGGSFVEGAGCRACGGSGYKGRVGVYEILNVTEEIRALIASSAAADEIGRAARRSGMRSLAEDTARKAALGQTSVEEALRVTARDIAILDEAPGRSER